MPDAVAHHPYDRPTDPAKRHSAALTDGPDRAGARAMLKAIGFTDEDLAKPLVGVATTWIETMPCNYNQRRLAEHVKDGHPGGRRHADGVQHDRGQRRRVDGHRGHEGVAHQPRGRRRLDRAGRPRPPARRRSSASSAATRRSPARRWPSAGSTCPASSSTTARSTRASTRASGTRRSSPCTRRSARTGPGKITPRRAVRDRERRVPRCRAPAAASTRPTR